MDEFDPVITRREAREKFLGGIGRTTLKRWEADGRLPPPIRLSPHVIGWRRSTLEAFIATRQKGQSNERD